MINRPILIYDGECEFCKAWIIYWKRITGDDVTYAPYQEAQKEFPNIPSRYFRETVVLAMPNGEVYGGAEAVFRALGTQKGYKWLTSLYRYLPGFAWCAERIYECISRRRSLFHRVTKLLWGDDLRPSSYFLVRWIFIKALGVIYLFAFVSFASQITGLLGAQGIMPAENFLELVRLRFGLVQGIWLVPSVFWLSASDFALTAVAYAGAVVALLLVIGFFERAALITLFALYLSITSIGQVFTAYQWDSLLLEVGFLAILFSYSTWFVWMYRWLLFRLMFLSGMVKLLSVDAAWRSLRALAYHFETQPLPNALAWYAHQLPEWIGRISVAGMFAVQLGVPFLFFAPRRIRFIAGGAVVFLELLIFLTGNYNFFNLLTIALVLCLFDDQYIARYMPRRILKHFMARAKSTFLSWQLRAGLGVVAGFLIFSTTLQFADLVFRVDIHPVAEGIISQTSQFRVANTYGLFAVMTTSRPEIIIEGSNDGEIWRAYEFKYKPGDVSEMPRWAAPHQPRLDWQMWFAALGDIRQNLWFLNFAQRLLEGSPDVHALLEYNPFPSEPPRAIRARLYNYEFTSFEEKRQTGNWWKRSLVGEYLSPTSFGE